MRLTPSSYGASVQPSELREYNPCHDPKTGEFSPRHEGNCEPGDLADPGRQQAVWNVAHGREDLTARTDFQRAEEEVDDVRRDLHSLIDENDPEEMKAAIAQQLGDLLEASTSPEEREALLKVIGDRVREHWSHVGGEDSGGAPDPKSSDVEDEYREYEEGAMEKADEETSEENYREYGEQCGKFLDGAKAAYSALYDLWQDVRSDSYGDLSLVGDLPGVEWGGLKRAGEGVTAFPDIMASMFRGELGEKTGERWIGDAEQMWHDEIPEEAREELIEQLKGLPAFPDFNEQQVGGFSKYLEAGDPGDGTKWDKWRESFGLETSYEGVDSFESWYKDKYDIDPDDWSGGDDAAPQSHRLASYLVSSWAATSRDSDPVAVGLQLAIEKEFGLGATYSKVFVQAGGRLLDSARALSEQPAIRTFVRVMYEHTQAKLEGLGYKPGSYITLLRGMTLDVDLGKGAIADVLLQPASSFSSSLPTAIAFTGHGHRLGSVPSLMAIRVPRTQILGCAGTGFGCANEEEFVVLGGRYPAFVVGEGRVDEDSFFGAAADATRSGTMWGGSGK